MTEQERQIYQDFQNCFTGTASGQRVLECLSRYCYEHTNTFAEGRPDYQNLNNGKRSVIIFIRQHLAKDLNAPELPETQKDGNYVPI